MEYSCSLIINKLVEKQIISRHEEDIYLYGLKSFFLIWVNFITALLIEFFTRRLIETIVFFIFFIPLRSYAGGYHTKNKFTCYCCSNFMLFSIICMPSIIQSYDVFWFIESLFIISNILIYKLAPLPNYNRTFDEMEHKVFRFRTRGILFVELIFILLLYILQQSYWIILTMFASITVAVLLILNILTNKFFQSSQA